MLSVRSLLVAVGIAVVAAACSSGGDDSVATSTTVEQQQESGSADTAPAGDEPNTAATTGPVLVEGGIAATGDGWEISNAALLASLDEQPPTDGPQHADGTWGARQLAARLTSMMRLRMVAVALGTLGAEVDLDLADTELNDAVNAARASLAGELAVSAPERLARVSPWCLNAIVSDTAEDAAIARRRLDAGEDFLALAIELNSATASGPGGDLGCQPPDDWAEQIGAALEGLGQGDITGEISFDSATSPAVLIIWVREIQTELADVGPLIRDELFGQDVTVDGVLGEWDAAGLSVISPADAAGA